VSLLAQDFTSENGRNLLRKNAFALMRLTRYKHAAATFLCSEPPMVKEACSILCKQCEGKSDAKYHDIGGTPSPTTDR
jgi:RAVE protein 1 C terminal